MELISFMVICRVEKWAIDEEGRALNYEFDDLFFLSRTGRKLKWYDEELNEIEQPISGNLRHLHRILNNEMNDSLDFDGFSLDLIFHEDDVFPYDSYNKIDYGELL